MKVALLVTLVAILLLTPLALATDTSKDAQGFKVDWSCTDSIIDHVCYVDVYNTDLIDWAFSSSDSFKSSLKFSDSSVDGIKATVYKWTEGLTKTVPLCERVEKTCDYSEDEIKNLNLTEKDIPPKDYDCSYDDCSKTEDVTYGDWVLIKDSTFTDAKTSEKAYLDAPSLKYGEWQSYKVEYQTPIGFNNGYGSVGKIAFYEEDSKEEYHPWWNTSWARCKNLTNTTLYAVNYSDDWVEKNATALTFANVNELRVVNAGCGATGTEVQYDVISSGATWAYIGFHANNTTASGITYSVYYDNNGASAPTRTNQFILANTTYINTSIDATAYRYTVRQATKESIVNMGWTLWNVTNKILTKTGGATEEAINLMRRGGVYVGGGTPTRANVYTGNLTYRMNSNASGYNQSYQFYKNKIVITHNVIPNSGITVDHEINPATSSIVTMKNTSGLQNVTTGDNDINAVSENWTASYTNSTTYVVVQMVKNNAPNQQTWRVYQTGAYQPHCAIGKYNGNYPLINGTVYETRIIGTDGTANDAILKSQGAYYAFINPIVMTLGAEQMNANPIAITVTYPTNTTYYAKWLWQNATLNVSASSCKVAINANNYTMLNDSATHYYYNKTYSTSGAKNTTVFCNDTAGNWYNSSTTYYTVYMEVPISITIDYPLNATYYAKTLMLNATLNTSADQCWEKNQLGTNYTMLNDSATHYYTTDTISSNGAKNRTVYCNDTIGNEYNSTPLYFTAYLNRSLTVTLTSPTNASYDAQWVWINATLNDTAWQCLADVNGTNATMSNDSATNYYLNKSLAKGAHTAKVWCNDSSLNETYASSAISFTMAPTAPIAITLDYPTNATYYAKWIWWNATLNTTASKCLADNGASNYTMSNDSATNYYYNKTITVNGGRNLKIWCNDSFGNWYNSATTYYTVLVNRTLIVTQTAPTNTTYTTQNIWCNATTNDSALNCTCYVWQMAGVKYAMNNTSSTSWNANISGLNGVYSAYTFCYDPTFEEEYTSSSLYFTVTPKYPIAITQTSPTNTTYYSKWVWVNATLNTTADQCWYKEQAGNNFTMSNDSATNYYYNRSFTVSGAKSSIIYCNDTSGYEYASSIVYFTGLMNKSLAVTLTSPTNSTYGTLWVWINATVNDTASSCIAEVNGTNTSMSNITVANNTTVISLCYQESANETNQTGTDGSCSLNYTGTYGNMSLPGTATGQLILMNYSKPSNYTNGTIWQVANGNQTRFPKYNITLPASCENYISDTLMLAIYTNYSGSYTNVSISRPYCYNGSWVAVGNLSQQVGIANTLTTSYGNAIDGNWTSGVTWLSDHWSLPEDLEEAAAVWEEGIFWNGTNVTTSATELWYLNKTLGVGSHTAKVYCNDSTLNETYVSSPISFTITLPTPIGITIQSPTNTTYYNTSSVWQNATLNTTAGVSKCFASVDNGANQSLTNSSGNWNLLSSLSDGTHNSKFFCNDTTNVWYGSSTIYYTVDWNAPQWSLNVTNNSGLYDPSASIRFNTTWSSDIDANGYNFSYFESNHTGILHNDTVTRDGNKSTYTLTGLAPGIYSWKFYANNSYNLWNATSTNIIMVNTTVTLTAPNASVPNVKMWGWCNATAYGATSCDCNVIEPNGHFHNYTMSNVSSGWYYNYSGWSNVNTFGGDSGNTQFWASCNGVNSSTVTVSPYLLYLKAYDEETYAAIATFNLAISNETLGGVNYPGITTYYFGEWTGALQLTVSNASYSTRILNWNMTGFKNISAYLLNSTSGNFVNFHVVNTMGNVLPNTTVASFKLINASYVMMTSLTTDSSGTVNMYMSPIVNYKVTASKPGYSNGTYYVTPTASDYTIMLMNLNLTNVTNYSYQALNNTIGDVSLQWRYPMSLCNSTNQTLWFYIYDSQSKLVLYNWSVTNSTGATLWSQTLFLNTSGTNMTHDFNFSSYGNSEDITLRWEFVRPTLSCNYTPTYICSNINSINSGVKVYKVWSYNCMTPANTSLQSIADKIGIGYYSIGPMALLIIALFISILAASFAGFAMGSGNIGSGLVFIVVFFMFKILFPTIIGDLEFGVIVVLGIIIFMLKAAK